MKIPRYKTSNKKGLIFYIKLLVNLLDEMNDIAKIKLKAHDKLEIDAHPYIKWKKCCVILAK